jgi:hypothetical protein
MSDRIDFDRFKNLSFEDFKTLANDDTLSIYQKIGFPDAYRKGKEEAIFHDIVNKLGLNSGSGREKQESVLLDIGPGCSELPKFIIDHCKSINTKILLVDSIEMLKQLPDGSHVEKFEGYFPNDTPSLINQYLNKVDFILGYSIFHYVFYNTCIFKFLDIAVSLLKPGGKLLLGDIPNISKRKRFFSTEIGKAFHKSFTGTDTEPVVDNFVLELGQIDDGVLMGVIQRYRNFGFEAVLLQQPDTLPMSNRREDVLITRI